MIIYIYIYIYIYRFLHNVNSNKAIKTFQINQIHIQSQGFNIFKLKCNFNIGHNLRSNYWY